MFNLLRRLFLCAKFFYTLEMSRYQVDLGRSSFCLYFSVVKMTKKDDFSETCVLIMSAEISLEIVFLLTMRSNVKNGS